MSFNDTLDRFRLVSGLSDDEAVKWLSVLRDASDYVNSLVTKEALTDYDRKRLDKAAGVNAYYRYVLYTAESENSFRAGDVSVTVNSDRFSNAKDLWEKEMESISDIISVSLFSFKAVK